MSKPILNLSSHLFVWHHVSISHPRDEEAGESSTAPIDSLICTYL